MTTSILSSEQIDEFQSNGFLVIKNYYDLNKDIVPIQKAIYGIIGILIEKHQLDIVQKPFEPNHFDREFNQIIALNRAYGGEVYDAVKQIPAFLRLISSEKSELLFKQLRQTDMAGIGQASYGIRIDNPHEDIFRSQWHQEFISQPQSIDGLVMWSPLVEIRKNMGPVMICVGSHKQGLQKYVSDGKYAHKSGAYKVGLQDEMSVVGQYKKNSPVSNPGDLIIMDYLTLHQSGVNRSTRSRWSIQSRFFNFKDPTGIDIGWKPSVNLNWDSEQIIPNIT